MTSTPETKEERSLHFKCHYCGEDAPIMGKGTKEVTEHLGMINGLVTSITHWFCCNACHIADTKGEYDADRLREMKLNRLNREIQQYDDMITQMLLTRSERSKELRQMGKIVREKKQERTELLEDKEK